MAMFYPNVPAIRRLMAERGISSALGLADHAGLNARTAYKLLSGNRPVVGATLKVVALRFDLQGDFSTLIAEQRREYRLDATRQSLVEYANQQSTIHDATFANGAHLQDIKAVIAAPNLSRRLLAAKITPSLREVLRASAIITTIDDSHKDHPFCPPLSYNHFVSICAVITLPRYDDAYVLAYERMSPRHLPSYKHTRGLSILFATTPVCRLVHHQQSEFDEWLHICDVDCSQAVTALIGPRQPILLRALRHKLDLCACRAEITPFGVVTNDQRDRQLQRVYTHFVFHVHLAVGRKNLDQFVTGILAPGLTLCRLKHDIIDDQTFVGDKARKNTQDIAVWRALKCDNPVFRFETSFFSRGFPIV